MDVVIGVDAHKKTHGAQMRRADQATARWRKALRARRDPVAC